MAYNQAVPSTAERNGDFSDVCSSADILNTAKTQYPDCPVGVSYAAEPKAARCSFVRKIGQRGEIEELVTIGCLKPGVCAAG